MVLTAAARHVDKKRKNPKKEFSKKKIPSEQIRHTDPAQILKQFDPFAFKASKSYIRTHPGTKMSEEDAHSVACKAILEAHERYDSGKGANFITYASFWIRARLDDENLKWRHVPMPKRALNKFISQKAALKAYNREIEVSSLYDNAKKIYNEICRDKKKLAKVESNVKKFDAITYMCYIESPADKGDENSSVLGELLRNEEQQTQLELVEAEIIREKLNSCISNLTEREKYIIQERVMSDIPYSLKEIGDLWGISRERARQIQNCALKKLKFMIQTDPVLSKYEDLRDIRIPTEKKLAEPHETSEEKSGSRPKKPLKKAA